MRLPRINEWTFRALFVVMTAAIGIRLNLDRLDEPIVDICIVISLVAAYIIAVNLPQFIEHKMEQFDGNL